VAQAFYLCTRSSIRSPTKRPSIWPFRAVSNFPDRSGH
jgi:hypothetical protein